MSGPATHPPNSVAPPQQQQQQSATKDSSTAFSSSSSSYTSTSHTSHHAPSPGTTATPYSHRTATYGCSAYLAALLVFSVVILSCVIHSSFNHQLDPKCCMMTSMQPTYYRILGFDETMTGFAGKYNLLLYRDDDYDDHFLSSLSHISPSLVTQIESRVWAVDKSVKVQLIFYMFSLGVDRVRKSRIYPSLTYTRFSVTCVYNRSD